MLTSKELALNLVESAAITRTTTRHEFFAMGTRFYFVVVDAPNDAHVILETQVRQLESLWTRFSSSSELMQINLSQGERCTVSPLTVELITEMIHGYELTDGHFNPSVLPVLIQRGFITDDEVLNDGISESGTVPGNLLDIAIDQENLTVTLPKGMMLDAGGIGKGLAADIVADLAITLGVKGIAVFAGGEVAVRGQAPTADGWSIGVQNPWDEEDLLDVIELAHGGVATSSTQARVVNDEHHLIDPETGASFDTDVVQATVLCDRAVDAEILTKACFAYECAAAIAMVEEVGAEALLVSRDGTIHRTQGWESYT